MKQQLLDTYSADDLDQKVRQKMQKFSGLLTEEAALRLIAKESGLVVPEKPPQEVLLSALLAGEESVVRVRVFSVQSPKRFEREGRSGRVCNARIADATFEANLVFWNQDVSTLSHVRRNDVLLLKDVFVKTQNPLELHTRLSTEILPAPDDPSFPKSPVEKRSVSDASWEEFDVAGRVVDKQPLKTFERSGKTGSVLRLEIADASGKKTLVCWDENAAAAELFSVGDAVLVESAYGKNGEIHASWKGRVMPAEDTNLPALENLIPVQTLETLAGQNALVSAKVDGVFDAQRYFKCTTCGSKNPDAACSCGGSGKETAYVAFSLTDATAMRRAVFFGSAARDFLGASDTLPWPTILSLKRNYLVGKTLILVAQSRINSLSGKPEVVGLHVVSLA